MKIFTDEEKYVFLQISGEESQDFLNGQFSCNIKNLKKMQPSYCSYLDISGRISSFFIIFLFFVIFIFSSIFL